MVGIVGAAGLMIGCEGSGVAPLGASGATDLGPTVDANGEGATAASGPTAAGAALRPEPAFESFATREELVAEVAESPDSAGFAPAAQIPPVIVAMEDEVTGPIEFEISDPDTDVDDLVVSVVSDDPHLLSADSIVIEGTGSKRSLWLTPEPERSGVAELVLVIDDGQGATEIPVTIRVLEVNDAPTVMTMGKLKVPADSGLSSVVLWLEDADHGADELQVYAYTNDPELIAPEDLLIEGDWGERTLWFRPQPDRVGSTTIDVEIDDGIDTVWTEIEVQIVE